MLEVNPQMILDAIADRRVVIQAEYDRKLAENEAAEAAYEATPWYKRMFCDRRDYSANLFILDPCWLTSITAVCVTCASTLLPLGRPRSSCRWNTAICYRYRQNALKSC